MESYFDLATDSRLPEWIDLGERKREDVKIQLEYWLVWNTPSARVVVRDLQGRQLMSAVGELSGGSPVGEPPHFYKVTINGVTELIVLNRQVPMPGFYVSDDTELRRQFGVEH